MVALQSAFANDRRRRAGIEGTLSRGARAMGLRRSRYLGLARLHLVAFACLMLKKAAQLATGS
ncbi:transposase [Methylobacterium sp. J-070]|uniref:transposase n=1 Tax=Methylobacterium sp. J-070 TaxID=2836650 RepID=UPI0028C447BD|nr:transposase [Methylobacterium sp. J-070]